MFRICPSCKLPFGKPDPSTLIVFILLAWSFSATAQAQFPDTLQSAAGANSEPAGHARLADQQQLAEYEGLTALNAPASNGASPSFESFPYDPKHEAFAKKFWNYLLANNYKHWSPIPGKSTQFAQANGRSMINPHGPLTKSYVNRHRYFGSKQPR